MTAPAAAVDKVKAAGRLHQAASAIWGVVSGVAPHVLHHVGPLAGAALLAGTGGQILFFFLGLALATPMLIRLRRRFHTWAAPAIALAIFGLTYTFSSLYIGPLLTGEAGGAIDPTSVTTTTHVQPWAATSSPARWGCCGARFWCHEPRSASRV
jgi:hypothetical protein